MKANELRIGNWISLNGNSTQVDVIDYKQVIATDFGLVELKFIQPIPLTEEWLLKLGAQLDEEDDSFVFTDSGFYVSVNENSEALFFFKNEELCEFNYVHQLQNLYFALTNEELKIELC